MPFHHQPPIYPTRRPEVLAAAVQQMQTGDWTRLEGAPELEADLALFHGQDRAGRAALPWCVSSGTAALEAIMLGHGIGPGDEVITVPYTWGATVAAILAIGAIPVFADVKREHGLIDPAGIEALITPRTRAVLGVHLYGHPFAADEVRTICDRHGIWLFEDGSQAHGVRLHGQRSGYWGHAAAFSCMGLKLLAGTEGGYALFRDPVAAEAAALHGKHPRGLAPERAAALADEGLLDALQLGWRPCAIGAAMVRAALPYLDLEVAARARNAAIFRAELRRLMPHGQVELPAAPPGADSAWHLLSLAHHPERGHARDEFLARLRAEAVPFFIYIPTPIHRLRRIVHQEYHGPRVFWHDQLARAGVDYRRVSCPNAEWLSAHTFEMGFNWTVDAPDAMMDLAAAIAHAAIK
jgi:dTDP-4-amino-4,6-dideoxygalactose transaminase